MLQPRPRGPLGEKMPQISAVKRGGIEPNPETSSSADPPRFSVTDDGEPRNISSATEHDVTTSEHMLRHAKSVSLTDPGDATSGYPPTYEILRHDYRDSVVLIVRCVKLASEWARLDISTESVADASDGVSVPTHPNIPSKSRRSWLSSASRVLRRVMMSFGGSYSPASWTASL